MANSLQDALRGAGLAKPEEKKRERRKRRAFRTPEARPNMGGTEPRQDEARRNTGVTGPRQEPSAPSEAVPALSPVEARVLRARSQAIARDPWLSGARQAQALRERKEKALAERARSCRLDDPGATRPFHFTRGRRIKRVFVTEEQHRALLAGEILVVGLEGEQLLLPRAAAEEIASQRPDTFVHRVKADGGVHDGEDPSHAVPDDLVW